MVFYKYLYTHNGEIVEEKTKTEFDVGARKSLKMEGYECSQFCEELEYTEFYILNKSDTYMSFLCVFNGGLNELHTIDKFTAVKMYDKVQHYWKKERRNLFQQRNLAKTKEEIDKINKIINYMDSVEMAVVISNNGNDDRFIKQGLDIQKHRDKMNFIDSEGRDIEDQFKDPNNKLQLVFVLCG